MPETSIADLAEPVPVTVALPLCLFNVRLAVVLPTAIKSPTETLAVPIEVYAASVSVNNGVATALKDLLARLYNLTLSSTPVFGVVF